MNISFLLQAIKHSQQDAQNLRWTLFYVLIEFEATFFDLLPVMRFHLRFACGVRKNVNLLSGKHKFWRKSHEWTFKLHSALVFFFLFYLKIKTSSEQGRVNKLWINFVVWFFSKNISCHVHLMSLWEWRKILFMFSLTAKILKQFVCVSVAFVIIDCLFHISVLFGMS